MFSLLLKYGAFGLCHVSFLDYCGGLEVKRPPTPQLTYLNTWSSAGSQCSLGSFVVEPLGGTASLEEVGHWGQGGGGSTFSFL